MTTVELRLNRVAQQRDSMTSLLEWFGELEFAERIDVLNTMQLMVVQSHPTNQEYSQAARNSKLGRKNARIQLLLDDTCQEREKIGRLFNCSKEEQEAVLTLAIELFALADKRRRDTDCRDGCDHWWHNLD